MELEVDLSVKQLHIRIGIFNIEYRLVAEVDSRQNNSLIYNNSGLVKVEIVIKDMHLRYGKYALHIHVIDASKDEKLLRQSNIASFMVKQTLSVGADFLLPSEWKQESVL